MKIEQHICDWPLATGAHVRGDSSSVLNRPGADFKSNGVMVGMPIYNVTQETNGLVTAVTEATVEDDTNVWNVGDIYEIYIQTKNSTISSIVVDKRFGRKSNPKMLIDGIRPKDRDLDENNEKVFSQLQPSRRHS